MKNFAALSISSAILYASFKFSPSRFPLLSQDARYLHLVLKKEAVVPFEMKFINHLMQRLQAP
jgi:hypothetical protein